MVADFDALYQLALSNNYASPFVSNNKGQLEWERSVSLYRMQVGVTDAGILDFHKDLVWARLGDRNLLIHQGSTCFFDHLGPLSLGDSGRHIQKFKARWFEANGSGVVCYILLNCR